MAEEERPKLAEAGSAVMTELTAAVRANDIDAVKEILRSGADIDEKCFLGFTPLMWTAKTGNTAIARLLIDNDADLNKKSDVAEASRR